MGVSKNRGIPQNGWFIMENPIKNGMIWGYPYFRKHPYINQPRATCWDNWLAPIRRWLPCAAPWRSTSKRTYNRWSGRRSMPCLKGGCFVSFVIVVGRKKSHPIFEENGPTILTNSYWLIDNWDERTFARMQVLKWSLTLGCIGLDWIEVPDRSFGKVACAHRLFHSFRHFIPDTLWIHHPHF